MSLFTKKQPPAPDLRLEALEAEYKNYRRRTQDARETAYQDAQRKTVLAFLPLYDDLERALSAPCQDAAYRKGIELMMQNLLSILAGLKVQPMQSLGKCFNPDYHEAVSHVTDETAAEERIVQDGRRGPAARKGRRRELTGSLPRRAEFFKYFEGAFHVCPKSSVLTSAPQIPALP